MSLDSINTRYLILDKLFESVFPSAKMGKINVFLKKKKKQTVLHLVHKEELTKYQFVPLFVLFINVTFSTAISLRNYLETLPGLTQKPFNMIYEDGLFRLFMRALILSPNPTSPPLTSKHLNMLRLLGFA